MDNRTLVKVTAGAYCALFQTISSTRKAPHRFYVNYEHFDELKRNGYLLTHDMDSFAEFRRDDDAETVHIHFVWLSRTSSKLTGWDETVVLPYAPLMQFLDEGARGIAHRDWRALSIQSRKRPQLQFCCPERLHQCLENRIVRHKLVRFLRDNFAWPRTERICFYNDYIPYSFTFQEYQNGVPGMCGGVILHGQKDMEKAYYSLHT